MNTRLRSLIRKEFIQTRRDIVILVLVLYTFAEIALCGWALTLDIRHIPMAALDRDNSPASRELLDRFRHADSFKVLFAPTSEAELDQLLDAGQATLGVIIPPGFGRDLDRGAPATIQAVADGTQPNAALLSLSYVTQIVRGYSFGIEIARLDRAGQAQAIGSWPSIANQVRAWYVPELAYIHFNMVSMVTLAVIMLGMVMAAAGIVREKEAGTLEQLMVTPIRPLELIMAKIIPMIVLEAIGLALGITLSYVIFGVAPHGPAPVSTLALFFALSTLAFLASAGVGIWIATVTPSFQQALLLAFFILFPVMFLSGLLVPVTAMPGWLQQLSFINPMRHYLSLALGVFLKGVGMRTVWPHAAILATFTTAVLGIGLVRLRRSLV
jgi:ABC-2 type transport system permease protein